MRATNSNSTVQSCSTTDENEYFTTPSITCNTLGICPLVVVVHHPVFHFHNSFGSSRVHHRHVIVVVIFFSTPSIVAAAIGKHHSTVGRLLHFRRSRTRIRRLSVPKGCTTPASAVSSSSGVRVKRVPDSPLELWGSLVIYHFVPRNLSTPKVLP